MRVAYRNTILCLWLTLSFTLNLTPNHNLKPKTNPKLAASGAGGLFTYATCTVQEMNGAITVSVLTLATRAHDIMHALRDVIIIIIERKDLRGVMSKDCKDTLQTLKTVSKRECDAKWEQSICQMYAGDEIALLKLLTSTFAGVCFLTSVSMTVCIQ